MFTKSIILLVLTISSSYAFVQYPNIGTTSKTKQALTAKSNDFDLEKILSTSAIASAFFLSSILITPDVALAASRGGGRSGGRAGGRASMSRPSPSSSQSYARPVQRTTIIVPPSPVYMSPVSPYGYGYNPMGGLGLSLGLNAIDGVGREIRESGQDREIARDRSELEVAKQRQFELEQRLAALERQSN